MPAPFLRGQSGYTSAVGSSITIPLPARNIDDFVFVTLEGNEWTGGLAALPSLPPGYITFDGSFTSTAFRLQAYKRITQPNEPDLVVTGSATSYWWGEVDVFGGCDYRDPGYLDIAGGAGNYATYTRTALGAPTTFDLFARVSVGALGIDNRIASWASNDLGFGLNASNRPYLFVNNTLGNPIGNVAANADIPGLTAGRKVWLWAHLDVASGGITYYYSFIDIEYYLYARWRLLGTTVAGTNGGTTPRVTNSTTTYFGTIAAGTPTAMNLYSFAQVTSIGISFVFSAALPAGVTLQGTTAHRQPTTGNSSPLEGIGSIPLTSAGSTSLSITTNVYGGSNRLVFAKFEALGDPAPNPPPNPALSPVGGWTKLPERQKNMGNLGGKEGLYTQVHDLGTTTLDLPIHDGGVYTAGWTSGIYILRPHPELVLPPASPQPPRLQLGCATEYTAWFTDGSYERRIDAAKWSALAWERSLDSISTASATFPDEYGGVRCLARLGGLEPWRYGLLIERDGTEVWRGPVIKVQRVGNAIQVGAADVFARYQKRFAIRDELVSYTNVDSAFLFRKIIETHAASSLDQWSLPVPDFDVNVNVSRQLKPREFKYAWDLLSELMGSSIDAYIANGTLYVWQPGVGWRYHDNLDRTLDGPYNSDFDFVYGTFTEEAFRVRPTWTLDGAGQGNYDIVPGPDTGEYGFRTFEAAESLNSQATYGLLDLVDPDPIEIPDDAPADLVSQVLASRASSLVALRGTPPFTIEGGILSEVAPISVDHLRPGSLWKLDVFDDGFPELLSVGRVRRISVAVKREATGMTEEISPTFEPTGATS